MEEKMCDHTFVFQLHQKAHLVAFWSRKDSAGSLFLKFPMLLVSFISVVLKLGGAPPRGGAWGS